MEIKIKDDNLYAYDGTVVMGYIECMRHDNVLDAMHTIVEPAYQGQGVAGKLVLALADYARSNGLKVIPTCSYILKKFENDKQFNDIYYK